MSGVASLIISSLFVSPPFRASASIVSPFIVSPLHIFSRPLFTHLIISPPIVSASSATVLHGQQPLLPPLLRKNLPTNSQHPLKPLPAFRCILPKPLNRKLLNAILDLLPPATKRDDFRILLKHRLARFPRHWPVHHRLLHAEEVGPGHVLGTHGDFAIGRVGVDVGDFVDEGGVLVAKEGVQPLGAGLFTGYEAFGAEDAGGGVEVAGEGVDGDDVGGLVIPYKKPW